MIYIHAVLKSQVWGSLTLAQVVSKLCTMVAKFDPYLHLGVNPGMHTLFLLQI